LRTIACFLLSNARCRVSRVARKPWIVPIPGTTKAHGLEENLGSVDVEQSTRYPESLPRLVGRESGTVHGAIASGELAAREIVRLGRAAPFA